MWGPGKLQISLPRPASPRGAHQGFSFPLTGATQTASQLLQGRCWRELVGDSQPLAWSEPGPPSTPLAHCSVTASCCLCTKDWARAPLPKMLPNHFPGVCDHQRAPAQGQAGVPPSALCGPSHRKAGRVTQRDCRRGL